MTMATPPSRSSRRATHPLTYLLVASITDLSHSYAPSNSNAPLLSIVGRTSSTSLSARLPDSTRGGDIRKSGQVTGDKAVIKPAWQENAEYWAEREALEKLNKNAGGGNGGAKKQSFGKTVGFNNDGGNTFAHMYQQKSTDEFKKPYSEDDYYQEEEEPTTVSLPPPSPRRVDSQTLPPHDSSDRGKDEPPAWFGSNTRVPSTPQISAGQRQQRPPPQPQSRTFNLNNTNRHSFQTSSTEDFKNPHGMMPSSGMMDQQQQQQQPAAPPCSKEVFKAPFQTSSTEDFKRSHHDSMSGVVGTPQQQPQYQKAPTRADNPAWSNSVGQDVYGSTQQLPKQQPSAKSTNMMIHSIGSLMRDPPGELDHPSLAKRVVATMLATLSVRYLHLICGHSPVLSSAAMTLLVSTCVDRRLGQAALCGSLAGMSGGHLVPNLSMAMLLGAVTSACYEILIRINNHLSFGIGGRIGATAFLATSIIAKYQRIGGVGRKLRRRLWQNNGGGLSSIAITMILCHMAGSVATIFLREASDENSAAGDPVRASSVVGLLASLFLKDPTAILAVYGGSFVGMSLPSRLTDGNARRGTSQTAISLVASFAGTGALAGLFHAISIHSGYWIGGWGGKAGLCAFAACWVYRGFGNVSQFVRQRT